MRHPAALGSFLAFVGTISLSLKAIFVKLAYAAGGNAFSVTTLRMAYALPVFAVAAWWSIRSSHEKFTPSQFAHAVAVGCIGNYLSGYLDFAGLQHISANLERMVLFLYPTLVVLLNRVLFRIAITRTCAFGLLLSYAGILFVFAFVQDPHASGSVWLGVGLVLLSALAYAAYLVFGGRLIQSMGALRFTAIAMTASCVVSVGAAAIADINVLESSKAAHGHALILALLCTVVPVLAISWAIKLVGSNKVAIIGAVGPMVTIALSAKYLDERLQFTQVLGMSMIVCGVVLVGRKAS